MVCRVFSTDEVVCSITLLSNGTHVSPPPPFSYQTSVTRTFFHVFINYTVYGLKIDWSKEKKSKNYLFDKILALKKANCSYWPSAWYLVALPTFWIDSIIPALQGSQTYFLLSPGQNHSANFLGD